MSWINPFKLLNSRQRREMLAQRQQQEEAESRLARLLETYRLIVSDPRYLIVERDLHQIRIDQVARLIRHASSCAQCSPYAERVLVLDLILTPRQAVDASKEQEGFEEEALVEEESP